MQKLIKKSVQDYVELGSMTYPWDGVNTGTVEEKSFVKQEKSFGGFLCNDTNSENEPHTCLGILILF